VAAERRAYALSPTAARVFLSAADAWHPARADRSDPGASQLDLMAYLEDCLAPGEARRLENGLRWLEWAPRFALRRGGFCWLPGEQRRAWLQRLERVPLGALRRRARRLRAIVDASYEAARAQASSPSA
jgi:hypothetical protein